MAFLPRRRLVLANARSGSNHTPWPPSQMPWDDEEADAVQDTDAGSQLACQTQEAAVALHQWSQHDIYSTYLGRDFAGSSTLQTGFFDASQAQTAVKNDKEEAGKQNNEGNPYGQDLQAQRGSAAILVSLSLQDYAEMYTFLTKGSDSVQEASAKELALYKLADLRQVPLAVHGLSVNANKDMHGHTNYAWCRSCNCTV